MLLKVSQFTQMVVGYLVLSAAVGVCLDFVCNGSICSLEHR